MQAISLLRVFCPYLVGYQPSDSPSREEISNPSMLFNAGVLPLDIGHQSLMMRCWYSVHRLPDSMSFELQSL